MPGLFSAVGMLISGVEHHDVRSCLLRDDTLRVAEIDDRIAEMRAAMLVHFRYASLRPEQVVFVCHVEVRYSGQTSIIRVQWKTGNSIQALINDFELEHNQLYGHRVMASPKVEIVAVRLVGRVPLKQSYQLRAARLRGTSLGCGVQHLARRGEHVKSPSFLGQHSLVRSAGHF